MTPEIELLQKEAREKLLSRIGDEDLIYGRKRKLLCSSEALARDNDYYIAKAFLAGEQSGKENSANWDACMKIVLKRVCEVAQESYLAQDSSAQYRERLSTFAAKYGVDMFAYLRSIESPH